MICYLRMSTWLSKVVLMMDSIFYNTKLGHAKLVFMDGSSYFQSEETSANVIAIRNAFRLRRWANSTNLVVVLNSKK